MLARCPAESWRKERRFPNRRPPDARSARPLANPQMASAAPHKRARAFGAHVGRRFGNRHSLHASAHFTQPAGHHACVRAGGPQRQFSERRKVNE